MPSVKKMSLPVKIMIGMVLGILIGVICHAFCDPDEIRNLMLVRLFEIGGNLFLNMFRMIVVPVVLISMILGTSSMNNPALLCRVGGKTVFWFALTTVLSSAMGIGFAKLINIGKGVSIPLPADNAVKVSGSLHSLSDTLTNMIPGNVFQAFVEANMLQVIVIAIISGIALSKIQEKVPSLLALLKEVDHFNMSVVDMILHIAPAGVFFLLAHTFSLFGLAVLLPLGKYILCFLTVSAILLFVVYAILLRVFAKVSPVTFYRKMAPVMLLALSTSSSNAVLPGNIDTAAGKLGVPKNLATFILSLGATINMNGTAIMQGCAAILIAQLYGIDLSLVQIMEIIAMCLLASVGTAGMPSAGVLMLGLVLQSVGLPLSGIALVLGVDRIVDMFRTAANITGDTVTAVVVSASENVLDRAAFDGNAAPEKANG